jgi:hypothetical protein
VWFQARSATCAICLTKTEITYSSDAHLSSASVAKHIGVNVDNNLSITRPWEIPAPASVPAAMHHRCFIHLCLWAIWNHRHDVVFRSETPSLLRLRRRCREDVRLLRCRLRGSETGADCRHDLVFDLRCSLTRSSEILSLGPVLPIVFYLQVLFVSFCCSSIQIQYKLVVDARLARVASWSLSGYNHIGN